MPKPTPRPTVTVRVCEPELVADGRLSSHMQYRLLTLASAGHPHEGVHDVRRRFSDFDAIAKILAARYVGMVLPPLPPKANPLQQRAEGFRQARMRGLAMWAERVARVPTLLLDVLTAAFFGLPGAAPWDAALRAAPSQSVQANPGQLRWHRWLEAIELPHEEVLEAEAQRAAHELRVAADAMLAVERAAEAALKLSLIHI